eukprot:3068646-Prymnesium_polylepis.1
MYTYAIIGMEAQLAVPFDGAERDACGLVCPSFSSMGNSFLVLFRVFTGTNWSDLMFDAMSYKNSYWPCTFYISFFLMGNIILLGYAFVSWANEHKKEPSAITCISCAPDSAHSDFLLIGFISSANCARLVISFESVLGWLRDDANDHIKRWATSDTLTGRLLFVDAAALVPFERGSNLWEPDGLHLSRLGYKAFWKRLAPQVGKFVFGEGLDMASAARSPAVEARGLRDELTGHDS